MSVLFSHCLHQTLKSVHPPHLLQQIWWQDTAHLLYLFLHLSRVHRHVALHVLWDLHAFQCSVEDLAQPAILFKKSLNLKLQNKQAVLGKQQGLCSFMASHTNRLSCQRQKCVLTDELQNSKLT